MGKEIQGRKEGDGFEIVYMFDLKLEESWPHLNAGGKETGVGELIE